MMFKTDIANDALAKLGVSNSFITTDVNTDNSQQAKIIRRQYKTAFETVLRKHEWKFATNYSAMTLLETSSSYALMGYKFKYQAPPDCFVIREIAEDGIFPLVNLYEIQKNKFEQIYTNSTTLRIVCNVEDAWARYTVAVPETNGVPEYFGRAVAAQLAMDIAPMLITNNFPKIRNSLAADIQMELTEAMAQDEGNQPQRDDAPSPLLMSRFQS